MTPERPGPEAASELVLGLLRRTHLSAPSDLAAVVADQARSTGATALDLYLVDYEQRLLVPLPVNEGTPLEPLSVAGSLAGRAFSTASILEAPSATPGATRVWFPLLDGTERVGVMAVDASDAQRSAAWTEMFERYAHLVAILIA